MSLGLIAPDRPGRHATARRPLLTPLGALGRGAVAGAAGTLAMDLAQYLRYQAGGGEQPFSTWEFAGVTDFETGPAPAKIGKRLAEALVRLELPDERASVVNSVVHFAYGVAWGAAYGVTAGSARRRRARAGPVLGALVFAADYLLLPATGLYRPVWDYERTVVARELGDRLVYGTAAAAVFAALTWPSRARAWRSRRRVRRYLRHEQATGGRGRGPRPPARRAAR